LEETVLKVTDWHIDIRIITILECDPSNLAENYQYF